jgi:hypothetical protein
VKSDLLAVLLSKTHSIPQGKNVLDAPASNTDGFFLLRDTCVSSSKLNILFARK